MSATQAKTLTPRDVETGEWWMVREVANLFRVSTSTILRMIRAEKIKAVPFGESTKALRIHASEVERIRRQGVSTVEDQTAGPADAGASAGEEWNAPEYVKG